MPSIERERWNRQHAARESGWEPSCFVKKILETQGEQIPRGRALDVATGKGRNALYLAAQGFEVVGIDISSVALGEARQRSTKTGVSVDWREGDLEQLELPEQTYQLVVNVNYLQRSLIPSLKTSLASGGFVIFDTYLIDQRGLGQPSNPDYLLRHHELIAMFEDFRVLYYREGKFFDNGVPAFRAGIFAQKLS